MANHIFYNLRHIFNQNEAGVEQTQIKKSQDIERKYENNNLDNLIENFELCSSIFNYILSQDNYNWTNKAHKLYWKMTIISVTDDNTHFHKSQRQDLATK